MRKCGATQSACYCDRTKKEPMAHLADDDSPDHRDLSKIMDVVRDAPR